MTTSTDTDEQLRAILADVLGLRPERVAGFGGETGLFGHLPELDSMAVAGLLTENVIPQPAVFWRRELWERVGPLDESLYFTMDYDLWLRMAKVASPVVVDELLAKFRLHPGSKSGKVDRRQFDEQFAVMKRYCASPWRRAVHKFHVEKVVWAYRVMRLIGK